MPTPNTILFAGGGTGGHIYPNLAILERLREHGAAIEPHFLVSERAVDEQVLAPTGEAFTPLPALPLTLRPDRLPRFLAAFVQSHRRVRTLIDQMQVAAVVATGGFVSGPAVSAARAAGVPVALVNLDAVPGRANRWAARAATQVFTAYATPALPHAQAVGLPLRRAAVCDLPGPDARAELGFDPQRPLLFVTAGSQGAATINRMMIALSGRTAPRAALRPWQVLHLSGTQERDAVQAAYDKAGITARVEPFCHEMGLAWAAATLAISRAGAGSVAEVWANRTPTIFFPYPYHKDQHQRLNAEPLVKVGGAVMLTDRIDPEANVGQLTGLLLALMANAPRREAMRVAMAAHQPPDGAEAVADFLLQATNAEP